MQELTVQEHIDGLTRKLSSVAEQIENIDPTNIMKVIRAFAIVSDLTREFEEIAAISSKFKTRLSQEIIPKLFEENGIEKLNVDGKSYFLGVRLHAGITNENKDAAYEWLKLNNFEYLIKPNVNAKSLSSAISSYIEETGKDITDDLKGIINIHKQTYTATRKC